MDKTIAQLLRDNGGSVERAVRAFNESDVLLTVPHAYSWEDVDHDRDFAAPQAARLLKSSLGDRALLHFGVLDRHGQADLNRTPEVQPAGPDDEEERRDWHRFVKLWVDKHPNGILLDIHSFPPGFDWHNSTTTLTKRTVAKGPLVVLLPVGRSEFGKGLAERLQTKDVYQGTAVNAVINMGGPRSVLLEFEEKGDLVAVARAVADLFPPRHRL